MFCAGPPRGCELFTTSIDLSANIRAATAALLNARLADAVDLAAQLKYAHWNIRGLQFIALHQLFDDLNVEVASQADLMTERVAALAGIAHDTLQQMMESTSLSPYPVDTTSEHKHLQALARAQMVYCTNVRAAVPTAEKAGDLGTADVCTEISRSADQLLWKIEH